MRNPWEVFAETHPEGTEVEGEVKNITEFGLFVGLPGDIDGMVHLSDLSWDQRGEEAIQDYRKGDVVQAVLEDKRLLRLHLLERWRSADAGWDVTRVNCTLYTSHLRFIVESDILYTVRLHDMPSNAC